MKTENDTLLTLKCSALQGSYWLTYCIVFSFASAFLLSNNFTNKEIGVLLSITSVFAALLQPIVASFADRSSSISIRSILVVFSFLGLIFSFLLVFMPRTIFFISTLFAFTSLLLLLIQPLINSAIFSLINYGHIINYGLARGTGSVVYSIISFILGYVVNKFGGNVLPIFYIGSFIILIIFCFLLKQPKSDLKYELNIRDDEFDSPLYFFRKYKKFLLFLIGVTFIFTTHAAINTYLLQIAENLGGDASDFGMIGSFCAILEIPIMVIFIKLIKKFKSSMLLKISSIFFVVKIVTYYFSTTIYGIYFAQIFQPLAFGLYILSSAYYVNSIIDKKDSIKGQSFLTVANTLGNVFGSIIGGLSIDYLGISKMLLIQILVSAIACVIIFLSVEDVKVIS